MTPRILFLHGLEGSPYGTKATWLSETYDAHAVDLDTSVARAQAIRSGEDWDYTHPEIDAAFSTPVQRAREAISDGTALVIGSSFGGAVLLHLMADGHWKGPAIFIAGAGIKLTRHRTLPAGSRALLIHGRADEVVPIEHSRTLSQTGGDQVEFWETDDSHWMQSLISSGMLRRAVEWALPE